MPTINGPLIQNRRGDTFFDVWEWGGRPGDTTSGSVDKALEAIRNYINNVRSVNAPGIGPNINPIEIHFRGSVKQWTLQRPFFVDWSNCTISGDGQEQTTISMVQGSRYPCFIFGMPRIPQVTNAAFIGFGANTPVSLSSDHWVDAYNVLNPDTVASSGLKWGLSLKNDSVISCPLTPFSHGISDGWVRTRQLTVDFCVDFGAVPNANNAPLFGMSNSEGSAQPSPWLIEMASASVVRFTFATTGTNQPSNQSITFSLGGSTGLFRISFQIDLAAATAQAYVNGNQVAVTIGNPTAFNAANNLYFVRNECMPFNIGKRATTVINQSFTTSVNHKYYGLRVANKLMYQNVTIGNPQVNAVGTNIGTAPTDFERYFDKNRNCVGCLALTDPPTGDPNCFNDGRVVTIWGGTSTDTHGMNFVSCGYFLNIYVGITPILTQDTRIQDMTVLSGKQTPSGVNGTPTGYWMTTFGQAIAVGANWELHVTRVLARAFGQAIGSLNTGANYTIYLDEVTVGGGDAGYYGSAQIVWAQTLIGELGRMTLHMRGCNGIFKNLFFGECDIQAETVIYIRGDQYGGIYEFTNVQFDQEAGKGPTTSLIVCEGHQFTNTSLRITDMGFGVLPANAVAIWLKDSNPDPVNIDYRTPTGGTTLRSFKLDGLQGAGTNHTAQVRTDGTLWGGEIKGLQIFRGGYAKLEAVPMIENTGPGGLGRVVSIHEVYNTLPRSSSWYASCHKLIMQLTPDGCYCTIRCSKTGTYNTSNPPAWSGSEVNSVTETTLAGYIIDNSYITCSLV